MESTVLGVVLDSSVLIAAERAKLTTPEVIKTIRSSIGDLIIVISALTVAELGYGIYRVGSDGTTWTRSSESGIGSGIF